MFTIIFLTYSLITPYYNNKNIHNFGNTGIGGKLHAEFAPYATKLIDNTRYNSINIRKEIISKYKNKKILDFCCGIGESTTYNGIGIDTSKEMLTVAKRRNKNTQFYNANAEYFNTKQHIDIVTCMFALHEIPYFAQKNIINNAIRIAKEKVIFVDISPNYIPSKIMLSGEPYLIEYLENINLLLKNFEKKELIKNHVTIWHLNKY